MNDETFESVLSAARLRADWAWRMLYESTAPVVRAYLGLRGARDPDGILGDVYFAAAKDIHTFQGSESEFRSWLLAIAHARLVDERRRTARRRTEPVDSSEFERVPDESDVEALVLERIGSQRLIDLFTLLSPDQKDVLTLRIVGGLSVAETASVLGKTTGSVKVLQHRGINRLRRLAAERGVTK